MASIQKKMFSALLKKIGTIIEPAKEQQPKPAAPAKPQQPKPVAPAKPQPSKPATAAAPVSNVQEQQKITPEAVRAYEKEVLEPAVLALLPPRFMELEGQQAAFKAISDVIPSLDFFREEALRRVKMGMQEGSAEQKRVIGIHAMTLCTIADALQLDAMNSHIKEGDTDALLHAWASFHFYTNVMNESAPGRDKLLVLRKMIAAELCKRKISVQVSSVENQQLRELRGELAKTDKKDQELYRRRSKELGEALLSAEKLYVIMDEDVGRDEPYLGTDGRMEVLTTARTAGRFAAYINDRHMANVSVKTLEGEEIAAFFRQQQTRAMRFFRLDNGPECVELEMDAFMPKMPGSLIFRDGAAIRMMFQREIQYLVRLNRIPQEHRKEEYINSLASMAYTMRYNAYRHMGRNLLYVLCQAAGGNEGKTMYTPNAMARAKELLTELKLPESALCEQGTDGTAIHEGRLPMMTVTRARQDNSPLVCVAAFTDYQMADQIRKRFGREHGSSGILAVTWDELMGQAVQVDGVVIDIDSIRYELPRSELAEVIKARESNGGFLFNLRVTDDEKQNAPTD